MLVFPYHKTADGDYFPLIDLIISYKNKIERTAALIDSGATTSIFRSEVADKLGIVIEKGEEIYMRGVGGRIKGYLHKLKIEVGGKNFTLPIIFSREYLVSLNLLGREGFFKNFKIIFDEKRKLVELQ